MFESFGHQVVENSREWASQWTQGLNHNLKRQQLAVSDLWTKLQEDTCDVRNEIGVGDPAPHALFSSAILLARKWEVLMFRGFLGFAEIDALVSSRW